MTGRRDKRRIAGICADARHFVEQVLIFIFHAGFLKLVGEIGKHSAGDLEVEDVDVNVEVALKPEFLNQLLLDAEEMFGDRRHGLTVKPGIALLPLEHCDDSFRARLRGIA